MFMDPTHPSILETAYPEGTGLTVHKSMAMRTLDPGPGNLAASRDAVALLAGTASLQSTLSSDCNNPGAHMLSTLITWGVDMPPSADHFSVGQDWVRFLGKLPTRPKKWC